MLYLRKAVPSPKGTWEARDFSRERLHGLWFFYKVVEIVDEIINDSEEDYCSSILDLI